MSDLIKKLKEINLLDIKKSEAIIIELLQEVAESDDIEAINLGLEIINLIENTPKTSDN